MGKEAVEIMNSGNDDDAGDEEGKKEKSQRDMFLFVWYRFFYSYIAIYSSQVRIMAT
jgi:hypothetical protein